MPIGKYQHKPQQGFQKGHKLFMNPENLKGKPKSEKTREKMSFNMLGNDRGFKKGQISWNKGTRGIMKGFWKGKRRPDMSIKLRKENTKTDESKLWRRRIEYRLWREAVFARDNWTCQKCKIKGGKLRPHHILNFAIWVGFRFAIDNGITFCQDCHKEFHHIFGIKNNTPEQITSYSTGAYKKWL